MKKIIGILTLKGNFNYGNKLQNYALQQFIESFGYTAETILYDFDIEKNEYERILVFFNKVRKLITNIIRPKRFLERIEIRRRNQYCYHLREKSFINFTDKYIHRSTIKVDLDTITDSKKLEYLDKRYLSVFAGSDQVWNSFDTDVFPELFFLPFMKSKKRNSFSASFGFTEIPNSKFLPLYSDALEKMNAISVREESGKDLIQSLVQKEVEVLLDPTFLLSREVWLSLAKECLYKPKKKYMLIFFLGPISSEYRNLINNINRKYKFEVVELNNFSNENLYKIPPEEFLDLFSDASCVITDSFHGTVFSIIFQIPFFVVDRISEMGSMNTRVINLLSKFELSDRYVGNVTDYAVDSCLSIDFDTAKDVISNNYMQSKQFFYKAIEQTATTQSKRKG